MAFELIDSPIVEQLEAVEGAVLQLAEAHASVEPARPGDAGAGAARQRGRLGFVLKASHGDGFTPDLFYLKVYAPSRAAYRSRWGGGPVPLW